MTSISQNIKRILFNQIDLPWLRLSVFMLASFCFFNCLASDDSMQDYDSKRFSELSLKLETHLREWEELRPAIKRLVSSEADLEFLITELSKMSKLKSNPTAEQLNNERDIFVANKTANDAPVQLPVTKKVPEIKQNKNNSAVTNVKSSPVLSMTNAEQGGQFAIHLASFVRAKNVHLGWLIYQARYPELLKNRLSFSKDIVKAGTQYHRLLAGMFKSKKFANGICDELKKFNQYCRVVKYKGGSM